MNLFKFAEKFNEKYHEDKNFADYLTNQYRDFEIKYNEILRPKYPSFVDEMKRVYWVDRKKVLKKISLDQANEGVLSLVSANFENGHLITFDNSFYLKYLTEKNSQKIYKVKKIDRDIFYYATLGENSILSVKIQLKRSFWNKKNIILKYSNGYLSNMAFTFVTYQETKQKIDAKKNFLINSTLVFEKIDLFFKNLKGE